jgi:hypothetical protein
MHIGKKIKQLVDSDKSLSVKLFSEKLEVTEQHAYRLFKQEDVSTELLKKVKTIFNVPFGYFFDEVSSNHSVTGDHSFNLQNTGHLKNRDISNTHTPASAPTPDNVITQLEVCKKEVEGLKRENELLREMNELLKKRG